MGSIRRRVALASAGALMAGLCMLVVAGVLPGVAGAAHADDGSTTQTGGQKVAIFEDVFIGSDQTWGNVVAVGGDVIVEGSVADSIVVVGGKLTVRPTARIGYARWDGEDDAAIVSVLGSVIVEEGAEISGRVVDVGGGASDALKTTVVDPVARPWKWSSIVGWLVSTIFLVVAAVIVTAIAPRQTAAVRDRARHHLFSSLGWGVLWALIGVPLITVVLIMTVVGILLVVPWLAIVVPIVLLFGFIAVAALLGRLILGEREDGRGSIMLAAVLGVIILSVLRWIPYAGALILVLTVLAGLGAIVTALWEWSHRPRGKTGAPTAADAPVTPPAPYEPPSG